MVGVAGGLGPSPSSLVTEMSADRLTGVVSVSLSSAGSGSLVPVVATVAVLDTEAPGERGVDLDDVGDRRRGADAQAGQGAADRAGCLACTTKPSLPVTDTKLVLAGRLSDTVIPVAVVPLAAVLVLVTVIV